MNKRREIGYSLTLITALMVLLIAALAGVSLWALRSIRSQAAHAEAARSVLETGSRMTSFLAAQPAARRDAESWDAFSRQVRALHTLEDGLQYVSISRDGVMVYHEQTSALDGALPTEEPPAVGPEGVRMTRKVLSVGNHTVPVVAFALQYAGEDGRPRVIEVGMRRDTVTREEKAPGAAIASMFKVAMGTIVVSFAFCALLVVWMMRRETQREAQRRQEEHLAFAGVLANGIVHDFRNPMSSVRLDAQMLGREVARGSEVRRDRLAELAARIRDTVDRMDKVFQEFLYVARPGGDEREAVDLGACAKDCLAILTPRFENAGVNVAFEPHEPLPVLAHRGSLQRAIVNVVTNAEQFSKRGDTVVIRPRREGRHAILDVLDQGPGVPEAEQKRIFDMFVSSRPGGTGLGLFLARTAVERCGGSIRVTNRPEGGACFRITLPLVESQAAP